MYFTWEDHPYVNVFGKRFSTSERTATSETEIIKKKQQISQNLFLVPFIHPFIQFSFLPKSSVLFFSLSELFVVSENICYDVVCYFLTENKIVQVTGHRKKEYFFFHLSNTKGNKKWSKTFSNGRKGEWKKWKGIGTTLDWWIISLAISNWR